jgi:hypothetical protein
MSGQSPKPAGAGTGWLVPSLVLLRGSEPAGNGIVPCVQESLALAWC